MTRPVPSAPGDVAGSGSSARALTIAADRARSAGDPATAEVLYRQALAIDAGFASAWYGLGALALASGAHAQAIGLIGRAVQLRARAMWQADLSTALLAQGHAEAARAAARLAVEAEPARAAYHHAHALALTALGSTDLALQAWRQVARRAPHDPAAHANLGAALYAAGQVDAAAVAITRSRRAGHPTAATLLTEGLVRDAQGDVTGADALLEEAERLAPGDRAIALGRAGVLFERGLADAAETRLRTILASAPMPQAELTLASVLLASGRRAEGWAAFEARRALLPAADLSEWNGRSTDQIVRLDAEQGLGDALHFLRYLPAARERASIVLRVPRALRRLVADSYEGIAFDDEKSGSTGAALRAGLPSLPHLLGDPETAPVWARVPPTRVALWRERFAALDGYRVGIVWRGNPAYRFDRRRSIPVEALAPFAQMSGVSFVALHPDASAPAWMMKPGHLEDFSDTAAAMAALDLVISVDSAGAHLAGVVGAPLWLLDRAGGDWRWRDAFGPSLYPDMQRFTQTVPGQGADAWEEAIGRVAVALRNRLNQAIARDGA